jgi:hypothetical protein
VPPSVRASIIVAAVAFTLTGCSSPEERIQHQKKAFRSLAATTVATAQAWLSGDTSGTYTRTALTQTLRLAEQERTALTADPQALAAPAGAALSRSAEQLSRLLAMLLQDVDAQDAHATRQHLAQLPLLPAEAE